MQIAFMEEYPVQCALGHPRLSYDLCDGCGGYGKTFCLLNFLIYRRIANFL